jgi:hypothetical protein
MKPNDSVSIKQVSNGWFVTAESFDQHSSRPVADMFVFQSFEELIAFLEKHFDFRAGVLISDLGEIK